MRVKEVAQLAGISVRTLHHYDEIGLLAPSIVTEAGYRIYTDADLGQLQQILFFRELGFPLKQIAAIVHDPAFDRGAALDLQRKMLLERREQMDQMIATIDKTIRNLRGEVHMTNQEKFQGFDFSKNPYEQEARQRWGDKAVDEANAKAKAMPAGAEERFNQVYRDLAAVRHLDPASDEAQAAIGVWYGLLNEWGNYSPEAFRGLGQMYVDDERFTANIDQFGAGLSLFMRDAMAVFADRQG